MTTKLKIIATNPHVRTRGIGKSVGTERQKGAAADPPQSPATGPLRLRALPDACLVVAAGRTPELGTVQFWTLGSFAGIVGRDDVVDALLVIPALTDRRGLVEAEGVVDDPRGILDLRLVEAQDHETLPRLARGEEIPCFGLTGPTAGSDATSIPDFGIVCKQKVKGKDVLGIRMTFDKRYITLAPIATLIGIAFRMYDPDGLLGDEEDLGISLALIPRDTDGLEAGKRHMPLNMPFQNGPVRGKDVFVPLDALIGGIDMAGQGWRMLVECLSVGRAISLPSTSTGGTKMAALATGAYARIRKQFDIPIGSFEGIQEPLARIAGRSISTLIRTQGLGDIYRIYSSTRRDGIDFNLAYITPDFTAEPDTEFDPTYMRALFDYAYAEAKGGYPWVKTPHALGQSSKN